MTDDKKQTPEHEELEIELTPFTPREKRVLAFICVVIIGLGLAAGKLISTLKIEPVKVERETVVQLVETKIIQKSKMKTIFIMKPNLMTIRLLMKIKIVQSKPITSLPSATA